MHIVVTGGPLGGYKYIGLFASISEAATWATDHLKDHYWIVPVADKATIPAL
jgi:hypothetical protein